MTAVAALATVATSAPAALAVEGDLAPETSEPTSTPETNSAAPAAEDTGKPAAGPAEEPTEPAAPPADAAPAQDPEPEAVPSEQEADESEPAPFAAAAAVEEGETEVEAAEYGSQQIAITMALDPEDFYPENVGNRYVYVYVYEGEEPKRSASCNADLDSAEAGTKVSCLNETDESPIVELGPGERATMEYFDGTSFRTVAVEPCLASECSSEPVAVNLVVEGSAPDASNRYLAVRPGEPLTFDVLAFDSIGDPDTVVSIGTEPLHGTVQITDDGLQRLVYTAAEDYTGPDTLTYTLTNSNGSRTGTVYITVAEDAVSPDFGTRKYRIGTQVASGAFVPEGTTTVGSTITITTYPAGGGAPDVQTCTTVPETTGPVLPPILLRAAEAEEIPAPTGTSSCPGDGEGTGIGGYLRSYTAPPGARVEITHTSVGEGQALLPDPRTVVIEPCDRNLIPNCDFAPPETVTFDANGSILPTTRPDAATAQEGGPAIEVDVLANDDSEDPDTGLEVTPLPESRGTVEVVGAAETPEPEATEGVGTLAVPSAGTLRLRYTPPENFSGTVPVEYTVTNSNGSTTGTLTITVEPAESTDPAPGDPDGSDGSDGSGAGSGAGAGGTDGGEASPASTRGTRSSTTGTLPRTGGPDAALAPLGALLVAAGAAALARARRRPAGARGR